MTQEGNIEIAIFMGAFVRDGFSHPYQYADFRDENGILNQTVRVDNLKYHTSWDWQIPAWSKLVPLIKEMASEKSEHFDKYQRFLNQYENAIACNSPETGQQIITTAINWHNTHNSKTKPHDLK